MRCLALAEAWADIGGKVSFRTRTGSRSIDARLMDLGVIEEPVGESGSMEDAETTSQAAFRTGAGWVVLDGYEFDSRFESRVRTFGGRVLSLDDLGDRREFACDALLNQNAYADTKLYAGASLPPLRLFGSRFALLRREFWGRRPPMREHPSRCRRLLVSMGGGDLHGVSRVVLEALRHLKPEGSETTLLVGPNNPNLEPLKRQAEGVGVPVRIVVGTRDMVGWMGWADMAIQAGGSTVWEACFMGLPSLIVCLADNQQRITESTAALGAAESLGWYHALTPEALASRISAFIVDRERRVAISTVASRLVDGEGALRVRDALLVDPR